MHSLFRLQQILKENSSVRKLISFTFELIEPGGSAIYGRIPFLLIADLLEGQTISCAEKLWNLLESYTDSITVPESFRSGNEFKDFVVVADAI